jgi:hypothetical protein
VDICEVKIKKFNAELGLAFGYAIVCKENGEDYVDLHGDHIPEQVMLEAAVDFMMNTEAVGKTDHEGEPTGKVVFAFPMTTEIADSLNIMTRK